MADEDLQQTADMAEDMEALRRRDFLKSLKKWSQAVIGGVALGALLPGSRAEAGWINSRGAWVNGGGGGGGWANRGGSWVNGGGGWINRGGSWVNGGGGGWVNRRGW